MCACDFLSDIIIRKPFERFRFLQLGMFGESPFERFSFLQLGMFDESPFERFRFLQLGMFDESPQDICLKTTAARSLEI